MNILEKIYYENIDFASNKNFKGTKKIVVDNYSDEAHFIYELLQNADDAQATEITFDLRKNELIVTHDGRPFSDKDVMAICSISMGTKNDDYTKIGKFGIGFKSVFVYTESPQVHSGTYHFEIRDLVLPKTIEKRKEIKEKDTVFVLPFNAKKTQKSAWKMIYSKLNSLQEDAILFLQSIKIINIIVDEEKYVLQKEILDEKEFFTYSMYQHIRITKINANKDENEYYDDDEFEFMYRLFKRDSITLNDTDEDGNLVEVKNQSVMIAYLDMYNNVYALSKDLHYDHTDYYFVFFPTQIRSNCDFYIHAPFVTKSSRDTIALNNDANNILKQNVGILIADSMILLAKEKLLTVDLLENLFFKNLRKGNVDEQIVNSFRQEYINLLHKNTAIIPCSEDKFKNIKSVIFTSEWTTRYLKLKDLFGIKWLSDFCGVHGNAGICQVSLESNYFDFVKENFHCKKLDIENVVRSIEPDFYAAQTTEWFAKYCELLVAEAYPGYKPRYSDLDKLPLIRTRNNKHITLSRAGKIYLNNGTLDEKLLENPKVEYLYKDYFKLKEYSPELSEAKAALRTLSSNKDMEFSEIIDSLKKVLIAIDNKKITIEEINKHNILIVRNQKTGKTRKAKPEDCLIGKWERTNGSFDLYELCQGVNIELIDRQYFDNDKFTAQDFKKLGCKTNGLVFYLESYKGLRDFFSYNGMASKAYYAKYLRPLKGKANNRQFQPLIQLNYLEEILQAPINIEKSIIILRLAKEFDTNIKDWVEWSSRQDFAESASYNGYAECYSLFGASLAFSPWLHTKDGTLAKPGEITTDDLASEYNKYMTADIADKLGMKKSTSEKRRTVNQKLESDGLYAIPLEDKELFEEFKRQQAAKKEAALRWSESDHTSENANETNHDRGTSEKEKPSSPTSKVIDSQSQKDNAEPHEFDDLFEDSDNKGERPSKERRKIDKSTIDVIKDIAKKTTRKSIPDFSSYIEEDEDNDEFTPAPIDYSKKIERAKQKSAAEVDKIRYYEELQEKALSSYRYSYGWFKSLLEMECLSSNESNSGNREVSISFGKVEREAGTKRTLVLKHPNRYIPHFMEELADIPLVLHMGDQTKTVPIEVVNIKSYTLRVKMKNAEAIDGIDLSTVTSATIDAKSPAFLLEELRKQFEELNYEDDFNMQENLCENIEFVFGPPGTGKTTHLAKNVLLPIVNNEEECRVLVLTPTNKAADVLVKRIMEIMDTDDSYNDWLIRFGTTGDEDIEQSPVFKDKTFDIRSLSKSVTVTTIARFPYDFFMPDYDRLYLRELNWDYIVIDEASMIPLANIILPLYKKTPKKFIIAGDPFQIEPITAVDLWKDENIYKMTDLDSFTEPTTIPHQYKVELLTTQYRSIPDIGGVFSRFAYGGILKHFRSFSEQRQLNLGDDLPIQSLNIIKFPVSKYESIYRCKKLNHSSSYQVYSALFTFEYVCYLANAIAEHNEGETFRIGVIAPYRAQADMLDRLLASTHLPKEIDVQVGTIHGFQGDECDIIFAVFNTPPTISSSKDMFLNKKNIINVSISRARDYLFVVMPDDNTENIDNLQLVNRVEGLMKRTNTWNESASQDLEEMMFGDFNYLENNAFSTSHQSVNVYGLPEKIYEIRTENSAVDIQIHRDRKSLVSEKATNDEITNEIARNSSYDLDETLIPEQLKEAAIDLPVSGDLNGWYYLVPYNGKLVSYTLKKTQVMFIPLIRNGEDKRVSVSVIEDDHIIFINENMFAIYEQELSEPDGIKITKRKF